MLDSTVDYDEVASVERSRLGVDGHLELPLDHVHHLLGVLVEVGRHLRSRFVADATQQHLLAADRMQEDSGEQRERLAPFPVVKRRGGAGTARRRIRAHAISRKPAPPLLDAADSEMSSSKITR